MSHDITNPMPMTPHNIYAENHNDGCVALWCALLTDAVQDLYLDPGDTDNSTRWFLSANEDVGSFIWVADHLNINRYAILRQHANRIRTVLNYKGEYKRVKR